MKGSGGQEWEQKYPKVHAESRLTRDEGSAGHRAPKGQRWMRTGTRLGARARLGPLRAPERDFLPAEP